MLSWICSSFLVFFFKFFFKVETENIDLSFFFLLTYFSAMNLPSGTAISTSHQLCCVMFWPWNHCFLLIVGHFFCLFAHGPFSVAWHALLLFSCCVLYIFDFLYVFFSFVWDKVKLLRNSLTFQVIPLKFLWGNWGYVESRLIIPHSEAKLSLKPHGLWGVQSGWWEETVFQSCMDAGYSPLWSCQGILSGHW